MSKKPTRRTSKRKPKRAPAGSKKRKPSKPVAEPTNISSITIEGLFGEFDYKLPNKSKSVDLSQLLVLYGDNGKTTILRLIYDALAHAAGRGLKTRLANTPFRKLEIGFNNGSKVSYEKSSGLIGSFRATFSHPGRPLKHIVINIAEDEAVKVSTPGFSKLLEALSEIGIDFYFLTDDRTFFSTAFPVDEDDQNDVWMHETVHGNVARHLGRRVRSMDFSPETIHAREIHIAINRLEDWFRQKVLLGSSVGDESAHTVLMNVIRHISLAPAGYGEAFDLQSEIKRIKVLSKRSETFSSFGLQRILPVEDFNQVLKMAKKEVRPLVSNVLHSYLNGYEAKLDALQEIRDLIEVFLDTINSFFSYKEVSFSIREGLSIRLPKGQNLSPSLLSSGERQLLLLLCNTLISRDRKSVFLIDEPELSLNVKWQRNLIDSLISCVGDTQNQFIIATHSLELLSRHREDVVKLEA